MKYSSYECLWCDNKGILNYVECNDEKDVKIWFFERIEEGFFNLIVYEKEILKNEG